MANSSAAWVPRRLTRMGGAALAARNFGLSPADRVRAAAIPRALGAGLSASRAGKDPAAAARAALGDIPTDYVTVVDLDGHLTLAIAVRLSGIRLIDNVRLDRGPAEEVVGLQEAADGK